MQREQQVRDMPRESAEKTVTWSRIEERTDNKKTNWSKQLKGHGRGVKKNWNTNDDNPRMVGLDVCTWIQLFHAWVLF